MKSLVSMSAKANAFSIAQLLDSRQVDVQEYVTKKSLLGKWTSPQQIELALEGEYFLFERLLLGFFCLLYETNSVFCFSASICVIFAVCWLACVSIAMNEVCLLTVNNNTKDHNCCGEQ